MTIALSIFAVLVFSLTLFLSAALMFLVEPMFGKMILPLLGGTPAVWNTCVMFYQCVVLLGYLYAHLAIRKLGSRRQSLLHLGILLLPWITGTFHIAVAQGWIPGTHGNPVFGTLVLLSVSIGIPMFVISATAPMIQRWFSDTRYPGAGDPYFLYAASNLGSFVGLLAYPLLVEPYLTVQRQTFMTTLGLAGLAGLTILCAVLLRMRPLATTDGELPENPVAPPLLPDDSTRTGSGDDTVVSGPENAAEVRKSAPGPASAEQMIVLHREFLTEQWRQLGVRQSVWKERILWILLSAVPSSLLLGTTTYMATDIASFPLLWVVPLALYRITFVIVFSPWLRWIGWLGFIVQPVAIAFFLVHYSDAMGDDNILFLMEVHLATFMCAALVCHHRLALIRPTPERLTEYYVLMSLGGLLGGVFNTLIAPVLFRSVLEYPLMIIAAALLRPHIRLRNRVPRPQSDVVHSGNSPSRLRRCLTAPFHLSEATKQWFDFLLPATFFFVFLVLCLPGACSLQAILDGSPRLCELLTCRNGFGEVTLSPRTAALLAIGLFMILASMRPIRYGLLVGGFFLAMMIGSFVYHHQTDQTGPWRISTQTIFAGRSFFGVVRVREHTTTYTGTTEDDEDGTFRVSPEERPVRIEHQLLHGSTTHGIQEFHLRRDEPYPGRYEQTPDDNPFDRWDDPSNRNRPTSYYYIGGPLGQIFTSDLADNASQIGVVGLGTGTTAALRFNRQKFTYFEIDPMIVEIARNPELFTYLSDNFPDDDGLEIRVGDARIELQKVPDDTFDLLLIDAFSSDSIPVHLITREAVELQLSKIRPDGLLLVHISNRHLELAPVLGNIARRIGVPALVQSYSPDRVESDEGAYSTEYVVLARTPQRMSSLANRPEWEEIPPDDDVGVWTDDYSNILSVMSVVREYRAIRRERESVKSGELTSESGDPFADSGSSPDVAEYGNFPMDPEDLFVNSADPFAETEIGNDVTEHDVYEEPSAEPEGSPPNSGNPVE
ncbi:MAG: fused MFS/spermidine synthase [Planctomycetia bacterium]|nr:fused MFS/spermidine synthase [Planctomycetia bacterium]